MIMNTMTRTNNRRTGRSKGQRPSSLVDTVPARRVIVTSLERVSEPPDEHIELA